MARLQLPLLMQGHTRGKRSAVTCALKCDNQCAREVCNTSAGTTFREIAQSALSRRSLLGGSAGAVAIALAGTQGALAQPTGAEVVGPMPAKAPNGSALEFTAIAPVDKDTDEFVVPEGFEHHVVVRWGDPLFSEAPEFDWDNQTPEAQEQQFGYNNDYTEIQEIPDSNGLRAVMFVNQEYTNPGIMFPETMDEKTQLEISRAAQGLSVVELKRDSVSEPYRYVQGGDLNRRFLIHKTEFELTGPAAGSDLVKTKDDSEGRTIVGTFANCSGGLTPWGTLLSGEENFHGYFVAEGTSPEQERYGFTNEPSVYGFEKLEDRFDTTNAGYENELNRFGYIIEVDPWDPESTPKKHSSLGRFKHEGANVIVAENGHVVAYTGDDERFEYLYKFVSAEKYVEGDRAHNMTLLEKGDLYVARFTGNSPASEIDGSGTVPADGSFDGTGEWLPLVKDGKSMVEGMTVEEVLVHTRVAADKVQPTKMDRPEDVEPSLHSRRVYMACTNNSKRTPEKGVDEANPRYENRDGHIVEIDEAGDQTSTDFTWNLLMVCGDPAQGDATYFSGFPTEKVSPISCPDNLAFDSVGNLWISTDGAPDGIGYCDGLFRVTLNGDARGRVEQFLSVPREAETCGPVVRDAEMTAFVSVQHPGEDGSFEDQHSFFPDYDKKGPRPTVVQVLPVPAEPAPEPDPSDGGGEPAPEPDPSDGGGEPAPAPSDGGGSDDTGGSDDAGGSDDTGGSDNTGGSGDTGGSGNSDGRGGPGGDTSGGGSAGRTGSSGGSGLARTGFGLAAPAAAAAALLGAGGALAAKRKSGAAPAPAAAESDEGDMQDPSTDDA